MRTVGIVMECNPFHEGHQFIIGEGKKISEGGSVIVVMSGDFVQRGIPAVQAKEIRVRRILEAGADMVLELPVKYATASAEGFASGAVNILNATGIVTDLVFGSESDDLDKLMAQARFLIDEPEEYRSILREKLSEGLPFPAARAAAAAECPQHVQLPDTPNDLLGEEYLKAILRSGSSIEPHAVRRIPSRTASSIREEMQAQGTGIFADDLSGLLLEKLFLCTDSAVPCMSSRDSYSGSASSDVPSGASALSLPGFTGVTPDLANRIRKLLPCFVSWTQFCDLLKTRNITYTAVSRALLHILLDVKSPAASDPGSAVYPANDPDYIRILGARRSALPLIAQMKSKNSRLMAVTDHAGFDRALHSGMARESCQALIQDIRSSELYDLVSRMKNGIEKAGASAPAISEFSKQLILL